MSAITVRSLVKEYATVRAVAGIDLDVAEGEVFALLGPNGAGKTTTVEILEGHRERTAGEVTVLGFDPETPDRHFRSRIGIVLQTTAIEPELTVHEAISLYGDIYPRRRATGELIELVGLGEKATSRIKTLSGGQKRRLELALGLVGDPDLLFLDEPTTGFDPSARRQAWGVIENLTSLGKTVLLTTHYMDEAQHLADRVAVIRSGRIVAEGKPEELGGPDQEVKISFWLPADFSGEAIPGGPSLVGDRYEATTRDVTRVLHELTGWALDNDVTLVDLAVERRSLEDVYLELTASADGEDD